MRFNPFNLNNDTWKKIYELHIKKFGYQKQLTLLIEENIELAKAGLKIKRNYENDEKDSIKEIYNLHEEYVDTAIMLCQFEPYMDKDMIDAIIVEKYKRACERVGIEP